MDYPGVQFVFSPALFPNSPLSNHTVFLHGEILETRQRNMELVVRAKDEKGEWEAYGDARAVDFQPGQKIRGYGLVVPQPDGKMMLAAKWIKKIETEEWNYSIRRTQSEWPLLLEKNPTLSGLKPFELPKTKTNAAGNPSKPSQNDDGDFVSAHQLTIEKEYL